MPNNLNAGTVICKTNQEFDVDPNSRSTHFKQIIDI